MEIIGYDESIKKKVTCRHCSAIIAYLPCDVQSSIHHDYGGGSDTYRRITCPNCSHLVEVK